MQEKSDVSSVYDRLLVAYDLSIPPLPQEYVQLIQRLFNLSEDDMIIDLGCGSGGLALALAQYSSHVIGLDSSKEMIKRATGRDVHKRVNWQCRPVERMGLGNNIYKLIISFEAFHLFPNPNELIRKCALGLKTDGYLCIGSVIYDWERPLKKAITHIFAACNINFDDWGSWTCSNFSTLIERSGLFFSKVHYKSLDIIARTSIKDIVAFLISMKKVASLTVEERYHLAQELEIGLRRELQSEQSTGIATYSLIYARKHNFLGDNSNR